MPELIDSGEPDQHCLIDAMRYSVTDIKTINSHLRECRNQLVVTVTDVNGNAATCAATGVYKTPFHPVCQF